MLERHAYWRNPRGSNLPKHYIDACVPEYFLDLPNVTRLVVETMQKYARPEDAILEIGAGTGRNLAGLWKAGFEKVYGIEINQDAWDLGNKTFPELENARCMIAPVENAIGNFPEMDVIYSQSCLMHLPPDQEWVITTMAEKARKVIVTIEGEHAPVLYSYMHNYKALIEAVEGWHQVETHSCEAWAPFPASTVLRVFVRDQPPGPEPAVEIEEPEVEEAKAPVDISVKPVRSARKKK